MSADLTDRVTVNEAFHILFPAVEPHEARASLNTAIARDKVGFFANGTKVLADLFESHLQIGAKADATGQWTAQLNMLRGVQDFYKTEWAVSRSDVMTLLEELNPGEHVRGRKRGAKVKFSWDRLFAEVLRQVHEQGPPENDTDYAKKLMAWCESQNFKAEDIPEFDTIRPKLRIWFSLLQPHRN
jgi:hypothetical protein